MPALVDGRNVFDSQRYQMLFGHLAVSALQHRYLKADLAPVVAAGIFPDVVDKILCQVLHCSENTASDAGSG